MATRSANPNRDVVVVVAVEKAAALRMLPLLLEGEVVKARVVETAMAAERITGNNFMVENKKE